MLPLLNAFSDFIGTDDAENIFVVGGTVRDLLLGRQIKDADIVVKADAEKIGRLFSNSIGAAFVILDRDFGVVRVARNSEFIDICNMAGSSIRDDLANRDLTINAMAIPLSKISCRGAFQCALADIIIDPFNGRHDLKYRIIRMVSEENLIKDPLRLLRVYRFASALHFTVEINTLTSVKSHAALISTSAVERITEELRHIVLSEASFSTLRDMEKNGLLFNLFPELAGISGDTWIQTKRSYGYAEHILNNLPLYFPERSRPVADYFSVRMRYFCLKLAVLFQDGPMAEKVAVRLKLSRRESDFIRMLSLNRELLGVLNGGGKQVVVGLLREFGDDIYALLVYILAAGRICQLSGNAFISLARDIVAVYQDEFIPRRLKLPLINGNDLMSEFGLSPSPFFKDILSAIELLVLEGRINSRSEALAEAGKMVREKGIGY